VTLLYTTLDILTVNNTMSTMTKLSDDFMKIPKLDEAGKNWVIYKAHFLWSTDARGKLKHVDGSAIVPTDPITRTAN